MATQGISFEADLENRLKDPEFAVAMVRELKQQISEANAANAKLTAAVEFYANKNNWTNEVVGGSDISITLDDRYQEYSERFGGLLAKTVLENIDTQGRDALNAIEYAIDACEDWLSDTEEECGHHPEWQAAKKSILELKHYFGGA